MRAANVIQFPRPAALCQKPTRQAMTSDGMPVRKGDSVIVTDTTKRKFTGTVQKIAGHEISAFCVCQLYEVICNDGFRRVVTADQIEALS
jgi:hypothetical protein